MFCPDDYTEEQTSHMPKSCDNGSKEEEEEGENTVMQENEDIRTKSHRLCREYLRGPWSEVSAEELIITKVSGGLSNLLYLVELPSHYLPTKEVPDRVMLRIYGQLYGERALEGLITESVICTLLSESQRGPRLFGVFPGGRIEEYIPARPLLTSELSDPVLSSLIAEKMAQIHMMNVPISKEPHWLWRTIERWLNIIDDYVVDTPQDIARTVMLKKIASFNLKFEINWLKPYLISIESPVVFCHNDVQEGNVLLKEGNSTRQLVVIDFEYCSYNYRGFDFANHFCEWTCDYSNEDHPYFWLSPENFPSIEQQEIFIINYLKTIHKGNDSYSPSRQEIKQLLCEADSFVLASHFFWALWSVVNSCVSQITFDYWAYGEARFEAYFKHKTSLLQSKINDGQGIGEETHR